MTRIYQPLRKDMTLEERFHAYDSARDRVMDRARDHAVFTLPRLLESNFEHYPPGLDDLDLAELFWHKPGQNAVQLANKLTNAIFPANGTPFHEFVFSRELKDLKAAGRIDDVQWEAMDRMRVSVENDVHSDLQSSNFRSQLFLSILKVIILPNDLLFMDDDGNFRSYRIDTFVIRRDITGTVAEIITVDWVEADLLPDNIKEIKSAKGNKEGERYEPLYTQLKRDNNTGDWKGVREFRETKYEEASYKKDELPYFLLQWNLSTGEDYGTSLVEQVFGLIRSGEATAKALVEGLAAGSSGYMAVSPTGITAIEDVEGRPNWSWVTARQEDVFALQPDTSRTVVTAEAALRMMEEDLDEAFMTNASARLTGERVTAYQVDSVKTDQDESMGGMLTLIASDVQRPVVLRRLAVREEQNKLPPGFKTLLDAGAIQLKIKTGLDALGRQLDTLRLTSVAQTIGELAAVFPAMAEKLKGENIAEDLIKNSGLDVERYAYTLEEIQQKRQAQQQQAVQQAAAGQAIQSAGAIVEKQLGG